MQGLAAMILIALNERNVETFAKELGGNLRVEDTSNVDDRGIELAEAAIHALRNRIIPDLSKEDFRRALAALNAVRVLTRE